MNCGVCSAPCVSGKRFNLLGNSYKHLYIVLCEHSIVPPLSSSSTTQSSEFFVCRRCRDDVVKLKKSEDSAKELLLKFKSYHNHSHNVNIDDTVCHESSERIPGFWQFSDKTSTVRQKRVLSTPGSTGFTPTPKKPARFDTPVRSPRKSGCRKRLITPMKSLQKKTKTPAGVSKLSSGSSNLKVGSTVKIVVKFPSQQKVKNISDPDYQRFLRGVVYDKPSLVLAKALFVKFKPDLQQLFIENLWSDMDKLSTKSAYTYQTDVAALTSVSFSAAVKDWQERAPVFTNLMLSLAYSDAKTKEAQIYPFAIMAGSIFLFQRNRHICQVQQVISLLLDQSGTTAETQMILNKLGITVNPQTTLNTKYRIADHHKSKKENFTQYVREVEIVQSIKSTISMCPPLTTVSQRLKDKKPHSPSVPVVSAIHVPVPVKSVDSTVVPACHDVTHAGDQNVTLVETVQKSIMSPCVNVSKTADNILKKGKPDNTNKTDCSDSFPAAVKHGDTCTVITPSRYSVAATDVTRRYLSSYIQKQNWKSLPFEVYGDNIDFNISPTYTTMSHQNESIHWFINLLVKKRVTATHLDDSRSKGDIAMAPVTDFLPDNEDLADLENLFCVHIARIMLKYLGFLKEHRHIIDQLTIPHPHMHEMAQASEVLVADILQESENESAGIIRILQDIQRQYVPHSSGDPPSLYGKVVFGGDVLTNERAYSAQLAMLNGDTDAQRLGGIIHRPEGLHRMMNFTLIMYQLFYKVDSAAVRGSLYQLRNVINRRDVSGPKKITDAFRSHFTYIQDTVDAYILAACADYFMLDEGDLDKKPRRNDPVIAITKDWVLSTSRQLLERYFKTVPLGSINRASEADIEELLFAELKQGSHYVCECGRKYKLLRNLKKHLVDSHQWTFPESSDDAAPPKDTWPDVASAFVQCGLLLRDTNDAYRYGDGDRVFRNAKFEMLYGFPTGHTKYRLWLWRMVAYEKYLLSARQAYEYKWNICTNNKSGEGQNIPNDNLVEMKVKLIKNLIKSQGANCTFRSAQVAVKSCDIMDEIKQNLMSEVGAFPKGHGKPEISKLNDVQAMVKEIIKADIYHIHPGRQVSGFEQFQHPYMRIDLKYLKNWLCDQKKRAKNEMVDLFPKT